MKKITFTLVATLAALCAMAQTKFWVYTDDGQKVEFDVAHTDSISFTAPLTPTERCNASDYKRDTIGTQIWMAENYRCSKYDTESEAYNASWLTDNRIPTSTSNVSTAYYADASDKSKWSTTEYAGNLTDEQVAKLGFLYNWAAAVGVEDGYTCTTSFTGNRQGICPNGWHLPSQAEWSTLADFIDGDDGNINAGKKLRTKTGWYVNEWSVQGEDAYGFAALPSGQAAGSTIYEVGKATYFWSAAPSPHSSLEAFERSLFHYSQSFSENAFNKNLGLSVRCIRNY